jgi:acyl-CoA synthetase (AMP-forming)/AMP-acid ligase II/acyl carrier protein
VTTYQLLQAAARKDPNALALLAPQRTHIPYRELLQQVQNRQQTLNHMGIGRSDRVAIVMPNGPEMASAFLSVISVAAAAPLNPNYQEAEYDFYLSDLGAKALLIHQGLDSPARRVAASKGIPVLELVPDPDRAGMFELAGEEQPLKTEGGLAGEDDVALVLHTSGTTSRPKIVPLTQRNLTASANNIRTTLALTGQDRCLNIMPLFHIHGLMAAVLASMAAGASVVCTPGYDITRFYAWLDEFSPTWYTAVPTMHQAILTRAADNQDVITRTQLRFVRSSSASLPPQVMKEIESTFRTTVIEAYGMTEASHQMTSNPLPPLEQKPGSVGQPAGPQVAIMAEGGAALLGEGQTGEIVIKGENVTLGYDNNPQANASVFTDGWFRTGDQGYFDADGYLFITGRLKETINKGGEKISPREVDEVLLSHPGVAQAVTFAMPDARLGEEVAAVVILKDPSVSERDLRLHAAEFLADFKVPRKILFLDEIPKGPTGKLQRIGLADALVLNAAEAPEKIKRPYIPPRNESELLLVQIWQEVLKQSRVGVRDHFLELGGDSFLATLLVHRISEETGIQLTMVDFANTPTIEEQARVIENLKLGKSIFHKTGLTDLTVINADGK